MSADRYKIRTLGALVSKSGLDPRLEKVLAGLGMLTVAQLYAAMKSAPEAFQELVKDYDISFEDLSLLVAKELPEEDRARLAAAPSGEFGMGQLGSAPKTGRNIIRRSEK